MSAKAKSKRQLPLWQESILLVVTALVMAVVVKAFFVQAFYIPSGSMEPTMLVNDRILVQKVSYWGGNDVHRGDIVVFNDPGNWLDAEESRHPHNAVQRGLEIFGLFPTGGHLIKRVIGVAGDEVKCCDTTGHLMVNGVSLDEPYLLDQKSTQDRTFDVKVPKGHLWAMGDNRGNSADSREHMGDPGGGFIPVDNVVGKAWLRVWPWNRSGFVHYPDTFKALNAKK